MTGRDLVGPGTVILSTQRQHPPRIGFTLCSAIGVALCPSTTIVPLSKAVSKAEGGRSRRAIIDVHGGHVHATDDIAGHSLIGRSFGVK